MAWTKEQIAFLEKHYTTRGATWVANKIGKQHQLVYGYAKYHGFHEPSPKRWTDEQVAYLIVNYSKLPAQHFADKFGFNLKRIYNKANKLGLISRRLSVSDTSRARPIILFIGQGV